MGQEEEVVPSEEVISVETYMKWSELCRYLRKGHLVMVGNSHAQVGALMAVCLVCSRNGMVASANKTLSICVLLLSRYKIIVIGGLETQ